MEKLMLEKGRFVAKVMHLRHDVGAKQKAALARYVARSAVEFTDTVDDIDRSDGSQIGNARSKLSYAGARSLAKPDITAVK